MTTLQKFNVTHPKHSPTPTVVEAEDCQVAFAKAKKLLGVKLTKEERVQEAELFHSFSLGGDEVERATCFEWRITPVDLVVPEPVKPANKSRK